MLARLASAVLAIGLLLSCAAARAASLDQVRRDGVVRCGGAAAEGLAFPAADGSWQGIEVDICRAIATAILGDPGRIAFRPYLRDADYAGDPDQVAFLTVGDLVAHGLLEKLLPGPVIFNRSIGLVVEDGSTLRHVADVGDGGVCFEPGTIADRALDGYFAAHHLALHPMPFQEAEEMADAIDGGRCAAVAGDVTIVPEGHRVLPELISTLPVLATSPVADGAWAAAIAWTVGTLLRAEANGAAPPEDGPMPLLPIEAPSLGLTAGWQARVIAAVGDYGAVYRRNFKRARVVVIGAPGTE